MHQTEEEAAEPACEQTSSKRTGSARAVAAGALEVPAQYSAGVTPARGTVLKDHPPRQRMASRMLASPRSLLDLDRQSLTGQLIDHLQALQLAPVVGLVECEVIAPDMVGLQGPVDPLG